MKLRTKWLLPVAFTGLSATATGKPVSGLASTRVLTLESAKKVAAASAAEAKRKEAGGVIDAGGQLMCLERPDDTFPVGAIASLGGPQRSL